MIEGRDERGEGGIKRGRESTVRVQAGQEGARDISTPAGSRSCEDGNPTGQV